jgi:hypothetical protein
METNPEHAGLSARAARICWCMELNTRESILEAVQNYALFPRSQRQKIGPYGYGWHTHYEITDWLGLPRPKKASAPPPPPPIPTEPLPPLTPQQALANFQLLLDIVRGEYTPKKRVKELERQLTGILAQGIQGDDAHPLPTDATDPRSPTKNHSPSTHHHYDHNN